MKKLYDLFKHMPDIVIVTDAYGYVLDFNRNDEIAGLKKGCRIAKIIPDIFTDDESNIQISDHVYKRVVSPVKSGRFTLGYTIILSDVTEEIILERQNKERHRELMALAEAKSEANKKLGEYALEVKNLSDYAEQLRIARSIHDDSGHAVTEIHSICLMCLKLMDKDINSYNKLIREGIEICKKASGDSGAEKYESISELMDIFVRQSSFPVKVKTTGIEPAFMKSRYETIGRVLKEAYHNTMEHSLADFLEIGLYGDEDRYRLTIRDNGCFRGPFEKGFGLMAMEEYVREAGGEIEFLTEEGKGFGIVVDWRENERKD